jgi:beta-lactamase regulating signal transducer with metallopeptidase domain
MATVDTIVRFIIAVLFNGLWEAALLAIVAWIALRSMPNGNATTRHSVLAAALLASLVLPVATAVITTVHPTFASIATHVPAKIAPLTLPKSVKPAAQTQVAPPIAAPQRASIALPRSIAIAIVVVWVLGALFVLVRLIVSLVHLERLKKDALPVAVEYRSQLVRWSAATKGSRTVRLCRSSEIAIPIAVGLFDAMILVPERFLEELEPADVDRIVLHELAHLRRADDWINAIERIASALLFFNPGIAWLVAQLDLEREVACDDWVLQQNDPLPYANCLAKVVETAAWPYRAMSAPGAFLTRRAMSVRIERLLTAHRDVRVRTSLGPTGIVVAALAALGIAAAFVSPSFAYTVNQPVETAAAPVVHHSVIARHPIAVHHVAKQSESKPQAPVTTSTVIAKPTAAATAPAVAKTSSAPVVFKTFAPVVAKAVPAMQSVGGPTQVAANSPAYIDDLASAGYTNLTVDQLIELRSLGVTAEYIRGLESAGFEHPTVRELVQLRSLGVQPDFVRAMRQHFGSVNVQQLCRLKALGITPEYADQMLRAYPSLSVEDLARLRALGIDSAFIERANAHGFHNLSVEQLVRLKISGIL